jgi:membrane protein YdbS with pleckstrin-like domain
MFDNAEIPLEALPHADAVEWQAMDPRFRNRKLAEGAIGLTFVVIAVSTLQSILGAAVDNGDANVSVFWLWLIALSFGISGLVWPFISVPKKGYAVRDKDIVYKSGVFWRTVTAVPFNRIQHVEKSSTPLDRRFNIATLQLFTAGGTGGDLKIHGLSAETAESLRTFILDKVGSSIERA